MKNVSATLQDNALSGPEDLDVHLSFGGVVQNLETFGLKGEAPVSGA